MHEALKAIFTFAFIASVFRITTPILLPALGGLLTDLGGSINVALEGMMLFAAFTGPLVSNKTHSGFVGMLAGGGVPVAPPPPARVFGLQFRAGHRLPGGGG